MGWNRNPRCLECDRCGERLYFDELQKAIRTTIECFADGWRAIKEQSLEHKPPLIVLLCPSCAREVELLHGE